MAVYQGARLRKDAAPAAITARSARATAPTPGSGSKRARPMGLLMAVIVATTMLGLVYLTQTLGASATSTEIFYLEKEAGELFKDTRNLQIQALKLTESDRVIPKARKQKLQRLDDLRVLPAP
jgi:hypothetical protein